MLRIVPDKLSIEILKQDFASGAADASHFLHGQRLVGKVFHQKSAEHQVKGICLERKRERTANVRASVRNAAKALFGFADPRGTEIHSHYLNFGMALRQLSQKHGWATSDRQQALDT